MSTCFEVKASTGSYSISIGTGLFDDVLTRHKSDLVIADEWFTPALASAGVKAITLRASEATKSLDAVPQILVDLRSEGVNRQTQLIAIGGGVVQDVTGFIASIYMRGVRWIYVPTTLLAMADSCIGGKSSINVGPYKNLVGTFHPPVSVVIDPKLALSLSAEQTVSGLIEACKICYCRGEDVFREYLEQQPTSCLSVEQIQRIIALSLTAKKWFIEKDEFDRGDRLLLNFGHTFGHALESASHFRIAHGVAVGMGMLCAIDLGKVMGITYGDDSRVYALEAHVRSLLGQISGLKAELSSLSVGEVLDRFEADKKHDVDHYSVILVEKSGDVTLTKLKKSRRPLQQIEAALRVSLQTS